MTEQNKTIFVFGSNTAGLHGAGAAKAAYKKYGARWNQGYGHYGDSFAIPTKNQWIETLHMDQITNFVNGFIAYAECHPEFTFQVTRIGCGLAGLKDKDMALLFLHAPQNCLFDEAWKPYLMEAHNYWGSFE